MINQMLDALQNKSAFIISTDANNITIEYKTGVDNKISTIDINKKIIKTSWLSHTMKRMELSSYIKEADIMAMIYYINEYGG